MNQSQIRFFNFLKYSIGSTESVPISGLNGLTRKTHRQEDMFTWMVHIAERYAP